MRNLRIFLLFSHKVINIIVLSDCRFIISIWHHQATTVILPGLRSPIVALQRGRMKQFPNRTKTVFWTGSASQVQIRQKLLRTNSRPNASGPSSLAVRPDRGISAMPVSNFSAVRVPSGTWIPATKEW